MRQIILIFLLSIIVISCKSTSSSVITTKKEAIKKNKCNYNLGNRITSIEKKMTEQKLYFAKKDKLELEVIKIEPNKKINLDHNGEEDIVISSEDASYLSEQLVNNASDNLGSHYRTGGTSKSGFDCSGLMYATFKNFDIILPRVSTDMAKIGRVLQRNEIRKGDLIFFKTNGRKHINHVGMVIEAHGDDVKFIHSSTKYGVIISTTKDTYYGRTFAQVNRVIE